MRIIVDTNKILSALIKEGLDRKIISAQSIDFYTVGYTLEEISKHLDYIIKKSGLSENEIKTLLNLFLENITIVSDKSVKAKMREAMDIMKKIDPKDAPIMACALAIPNDGIWTEDRHFEKQKKIKIWNSYKLLDYI